MDVFSAIADRRSIRSYSSKPVEEEKLKKVLEAARLSPSASNMQNWKFIVVKNPETRQKITEATFGQAFVGEAPVLLVACGTDPLGTMACGQNRYTVDLSIAVAYMILEAFELGLGTCWLGKFDEKAVKEILRVPENTRIVAVTPLGYAKESPGMRPRKALQDIVCYEMYE